MAQDFLTTYAPLANDVAQHTGLDPTVVLGIIDTETSGGTRVLGNNIFGISPGGKGGQYVAKYTDVEAATEAFIKLMKQPRYARAVAAETPQAQAQALVAAGYNTVDKTYAAKVGNRALQIGKELGYQDDTAPAVAPAAAPAPAAAQPGEDPRMATLAGGAPAGRQAEDPRMAKLDEDARQAEQNPPPRTGIMGAVDSAVAAITGPGQRLSAQPNPQMADPAALAADVSYTQAPAEGLVQSIINTPADGPVQRIAKATVKGAQENPLITPAGQAELASGGPLSRFVYNPILTGAGAIMGGMSGALSQGAMEVGSAIDPKLGRDLNALLAVAPAAAMMPGGIRPGGGPVTPGTIARNTLQPWEEARTPVPRYEYNVEPFRTREGNIEAYLLQQTPEALREMARTDPAVAKWLAENPNVKTGTVEAQAAAERRQRFGDEPAPPEPVTPDLPETPAQVAERSEADRLSQPSEEGGGRPIQPTRKAAGAEATSEAIPEKTREQRIVDLRKDVGQTVADRADVGRTGPGSLRDENVYIEGMPQRAEAHKDLSNQAALDHYALMESGTDTTYKSAQEARVAERNAHMTDNVAEPIIGDENTIKFGKEERLKANDPETMGVFRNQTPADPALLDNAHTVFDAQINSFTKSDPKRAQLEAIKRDLVEAGNSPTELRKVRDRLSGVLEDTGASDTQAAQNRALRHHIEEMIQAVDPAIQSGAPRWGEWRQAWEQASRPINAQEFLQPYGKGGKKSLWDKEGMIKLDRVQRLLEDIAKDHRNPTGKSLGLTDDQIQAFVNIRNELAPGFISDVRGRSKGSPSTKLFEAKQRLGTSPNVQVALEGVGHLLGGLGSLYSPVALTANAALAGYRLATPKLMEWKAGRQANAMTQYNQLIQEHLLNPAGDSGTPYPNPLTFKPLSPKKFIRSQQQP